MVAKNEGKKKEIKEKRRRIRKKNKPAFNPLNLGFMKSVKDRWRKPRGTANKKRKKNRFAGALPKIGYRNPETVRGLRSDGRREVLVRNLNDVAALKGARDVVIRLASTLGARKRALIDAQAKGLGIKIINFKANVKANLKENLKENVGNKG